MSCLYYQAIFIKISNQINDPLHTGKIITMRKVTDFYNWNLLLFVNYKWGVPLWTWRVN